MKTGQIGANVGFAQTSGQSRQLTLRDQLQRVVNLRGVNHIHHDTHGEMSITKETALSLLRVSDAKISASLDLMHSLRTGMGVK